MKKKFLCLLMACVLCLSMLPLAVSSAEEEVKSVAADTAAASQPETRVYRAGAVNASSGSGVVFQPYEFEISGNNHVSARVNVPSGQMRASGVNAEEGNSTEPVKEEVDPEGEATVSVTANVDQSQSPMVLTATVSLSNFVNASRYYYFFGGIDCAGDEGSLIDNPSQFTIEAPLTGFTPEANSNYTFTISVSVIDCENGDMGRTASGNATINLSVPPEKTVTDLAEATISLSEDSFEEDGTEKKPTVTVTVNGTTLKEGTDYTVTYADNKNAGNATVTIEGKGDYTGKKTRTFEITAKSTSEEQQNATQTVEPDVEQQNSTQTVEPDIEQQNSTQTVEPDVEQQNSTQETKPEGNTTETKESKPVDNANKTEESKPVDNSTKTEDPESESGKDKPSPTLPIGPTAITPENIRVEVTANPDDPSKPIVNVYYSGDHQLKEGRDYTLTFGKDEKGKGTVKITGMGDLSGSVTVSYTKEKNTLAFCKPTKTELKNDKQRTIQLSAKAKKDPTAKLTYKKISVKCTNPDTVFSTNDFKVSRAGKITVKKGVAPGTYKLNIKITAAATQLCLKTTFNRTVTIKIKEKKGK